MHSRHPRMRVLFRDIGVLGHHLDESEHPISKGSGANSRHEQTLPCCAVPTSSPKHRVPNFRRSSAVNVQTPPYADC
jgi:hypothetical protein